MTVKTGFADAAVGASRSCNACKPDQRQLPDDARPRQLRVRLTANVVVFRYPQEADGGAGTRRLPEFGYGAAVDLRDEL